MTELPKSRVTVLLPHSRALQVCSNILKPSNGLRRVVLGNWDAPLDQVIPTMDLINGMVSRLSFTALFEDASSR
jgi:hypothetical protein